MSKFLFMKPVLEQIADGAFFKKAFAWVLRIIAGLMAFGSLLGWFYMWYLLFSSKSAKIIMGGVVIQVLFAVLVYVIVHTLLIRAGNIDELESAKDYMVIPISGIFFKMVGEISGSVVAFFGVIGGIASWVGAGALMRMVPGMSAGGSGFIAGLTSIITGVLGGFFLLVLFYLIAEQITVLADIARNTKK